MWVPREQNKSADALATTAILTRSCWEDFGFVSGTSPGDHIVAYFDGGSRDIDGVVSAGCGVIVLLYSQRLEQPVIIFQGVFHIGEATNNEAESTGMWLAVKAVFAYVAWLHGRAITSVVDFCSEG